MTYILLLSQKAWYLSAIDIQNIKVENKPHCRTSKYWKNICLNDAWKNVGSLQTEHTYSGVCHEAVVAHWGSAGSANSIPLYSKHLNESSAWIKRVLLVEGIL